MSQRIKATILGHSGLPLSSVLDLPDVHPVRAFAVFAHCFTCGKDVLAATRIAQRLSEVGIGVLRFDFTGLGGSAGDFSETNFSTNLEDLVQVSAWLEAHHRAPELLIGHSLGGAAVLAARQKIPSVRAVVTIGAPALPAHVQRQFADQVELIEQQGMAEVALAGRPFTLRRQFIEDLRLYGSMDHISRLNAALLMFHSPVDETVPIHEAGKLYTAAKHPKSFVSLDDADHLLTRREDAAYVADVIAAWASRYL